MMQSYWHWHLYASSVNAAGMDTECFANQIYCNVYATSEVGSR